MKQHRPIKPANWIPAILLFLSIFLLLLAQNLPAFAEWYATGPYRVLSHWGNLLTSLAYFSVGEMLVLTAFLSIIGCVVFFVWAFLKKREMWCKLLLRFSRGLLSIISLLLFLFTLFCGINYSRYTFSQTSGLHLTPSSEEELQQLCQSLAEEVTLLREQVNTDSDGVMSLDATFSDITGYARSAMQKAASDYPLLDGTYLGPKPVLFSRALSHCNITGIFFPFTLEANVNTDIPDYSLPSTMCHELAHLSGFMREDEANFIAYLACERSERIEFQYSGKMLAYIYTSNALYAENPQAAQKISASLGEGVALDLSANTAYWDQFETPMAEVAQQVNNAYLKANRQYDGVKGYGRVVDLLLAEWREEQTATNDS